jgi:FkbM family methyltransferase
MLWQAIYFWNCGRFMAFSNAKSILTIHSPSGSWKLLLTTAIFTRPRYQAVWRALLQPFIHNGEISVRYRCAKRYVTMFLRVSDLLSDLQCALELAVRDTYHLDPDFQPDLVIDGGGNIGLFTLRAAATFASSSNSPAKFVICEPMAHNIQQIQRHLDINQMEAEIMRGCLGGTRRSMPFYCRESINSSFDPAKPYDSVIDIPVHLLEGAIGSYPAKRILIKLDIEGMEVETLSAFVPFEQRPVYLVGELHDVSINAPVMDRLFQDHGWTYELGEVADDQALFRACSPAALPLLPSMTSVKRAVVSEMT